MVYTFDLGLGICDSLLRVPGLRLDGTFLQRLRDLGVVDQLVCPLAADVELGVEVLGERRVPERLPVL